MSASWDPRIARLEQAKLPEPEPDMTGWTTVERVTWEAKRKGLAAMVRESGQLDDEDRLSEEALDARDARDEAILAERAAKAAAERLAERPGSAAAQIQAKAARTAADEAWRLAEAAKLRAEEAARRPKPATPAIDSQAVPETPAPTPAPDPAPKPKRKRKPREPGQPPRRKQWWEERARWKLRGPVDEDERRGRPLYECIHEYDPLDADYDYDPIADDD
jgi:hypothetical protein